MAEFVVERGGRTALAEVADAVMDGASTGEALQRVPTLPQTPEALERLVL